MGDDVRIALAAANMTKAIMSRKNLLARIRRLALEAADCQVLVLPEYFAMLALDYAPPDLKAAGQIPWMAQEFEDMNLLEEIEDIASRMDVAILPGTWPVQTINGYRNRAHFITSDGVAHTQDKMALTDEETGRMGWYLKPGQSLDVFEYGGVKCAIAICHDTTNSSEFESFKSSGVQLVFVPSMCEFEGNPKAVDSHAFIFDHARKRSEEISCYFACVGSVGVQILPTGDEVNVGGAALYHCGTGLAEIGPFSKGRGTSALMLKVDADV
jgi:predicted amidohydrolase